MTDYERLAYDTALAALDRQDRLLEYRCAALAVVAEIVVLGALATGRIV